MPVSFRLRRPLLAVAALVVSATGLLVSAAPAGAHHEEVNLTVVSATEWGPDSSGYRYIMGEVRNTGPINARSVSLDFSLFDSGGRLLATDSTYASADVLEPGQTSPYVASFIPPYAYHHFEVSIHGSATPEQANRNFHARVTNQFTDPAGYHHIVGQVTNLNRITADFVEVHLSLLGAGGRLVDAASTYVDTNGSAQMAPGETASFEVLMLPGSPAYATVAAFADSPTPPTLPRSGYWMVDVEGEVYAFGNARDHGGTYSSDVVVDIAPTPTFNGYWLVDAAGEVTAQGDAVHFGNADTSILAEDEFVTSLSPTKSGRGYWIFTSRGRVLTFGDAVHRGDVSRVRLNGPVYDSIPTTTGGGYYMVASDGGIFAFGDAKFYGSMGGKPLNAPVMSLVPDRDGAGYWLVASDGGIFSFDAPFRGSMGGRPLNEPVSGMVRFGNGYLMVAADGGIFNFSDRDFYGSLGDHPLDAPILAVAALDES